MVLPKMAQRLNPAGPLRLDKEVLGMQVQALTQLLREGVNRCVEVFDEKRGPYQQFTFNELCQMQGWLMACQDAIGQLQRAEAYLHPRRSLTAAEAVQLSTAWGLAQLVEELSERLPERT